MRGQKRVLKAVTPVFTGHGRAYDPRIHPFS
jgi:hypothetical protein